MHCDRPYWCRRLTADLRKASPVKYAYLKKDRISVEYYTGFKRNYIFGSTCNHKRWARPITREQSGCTWPVEILYEHVWNPLDPQERAVLSQYFNIPRTKIKSLSYVDKELLIQHLMGVIQATGYLKPYRRDEEITADLNAAKTIHDPVAGIFNFYRYRGRPVRAIIERYYDITKLYRYYPNRTIAHAFTNKRILFVALQNLINTSNLDLNITGLHSMLYRMSYGPKWYSPSMYASIIKHLFKISTPGILVDASPNLYEKAITAWSLGMKYAPLVGSPSSELVNRMGLHVVQPKPPYDLLVVDNSFKFIGFDELDRLRSKSTNMLVFVPGDLAADVTKEMKPSDAARIKVTIGCRRRLDYLFLYKS